MEGNIISLPLSACIIPIPSRSSYILTKQLRFTLTSIREGPDQVLPCSTHLVEQEAYTPVL